MSRENDTPVLLFSLDRNNIGCSLSSTLNGSNFWVLYPLPFGIEVSSIIELSSRFILSTIMRKG